MTLMDMHSLQASLKAIECVCTPEIANAKSGETASHKNEVEAKRPNTGATKQAHKKVRLEKSCKLCKKHGGTHTTHATKDCLKYKKDGTVKAELHTATRLLFTPVLPGFTIFIYFYCPWSGPCGK
jgi:hypothetical protein